MKKTVDKYMRKSDKIEQINIQKLKKETNLKEIEDELKYRVYYKDIYKDSEGFYDFECAISEKCRDLMAEAFDRIELYIENNIKKGSEIYKHRYPYIMKILTEQLFEPIWYGFMAEEYNIDLFSKMGIEVYAFTDKEKEKERKFDDDYSIDHMIKLNGDWVGVQSKCRTFLKKDAETKKYYYDKHKKCLNERKNIKNIYYIFYAKDEPHKKCKFDSYKKIDNIELDGFLIPYDEVIKIVDYSAICNVDYYDFDAVDYQSLFTEEEEEDLDDLPF